MNKQNTKTEADNSSAVNTIVIGTTIGNEDIYSKEVHPERQIDEEHSVDVIILTEGNMLNIGYYDYEAGKWRFHTDTLVDMYEPGNEVNFVWVHADEALREIASNLK